MAEIRSQVDGEFEGIDDEVVIRLTNGQTWQQIGYHYHYFYAYMPAVRIVRDDGVHKMHVQGMPFAFPVQQID